MSTLSDVPTNWKGIKAAPQEEDEGYTLTTIYQCLYLMYSHCTKWLNERLFGSGTSSVKGFSQNVVPRSKIANIFKAN